MTVEHTELAIVGGGPAGLAAAHRASEARISVTIIDEQQRLGGQIFRQPPRSFQVASWMSAEAYRNGLETLRRIETAASVTKMLSTSVWAIFREHGAKHGNLMLFDGSRIARLAADRVVLAAGCYERPIPFPGWHLPGVMSAGAIQTLLKSQQVAVARRVVLAGSHPLLLVVAAQLLAAGVEIAALVFAQSGSTLVAGLRSPRALWSGRHAFGQAVGALGQLRRARVPLYFGSLVTAARGDGRIESVLIESTRRSVAAVRAVDCDALGVCYGFCSSSELARQVGARSEWSAGSGWRVQADEWLRSSVSGVYVAGEQLGIAGMEAAFASGELAALAVALDLGKVAAPDAGRHARRLRRTLARYRRFASWLAELSTPSEELLAQLRTPDTVLCRCEDVTLADVEATVRAHPEAGDASSVKLLARTGMGPCQGRMCEGAVRSVLAQKLGVSPASIPGYTVRPPVRPVPLGALADFDSALDIDPAALAIASPGHQNEGMQ